MGMTGLLMYLAIGAVSGWLAGKLLRGGGFGLLGDIVRDRDRGRRGRRLSVRPGRTQRGLGSRRLDMNAGID